MPLLAPKADLEARLDSLLKWEERYFNNGITCAIKDRPDTSCHACPLYKGDDVDSPYRGLCRVGREQERVLTAMACRA